MTFDADSGAVVADPGNSYQHNSHDNMRNTSMVAYSPYSLPSF
jgi:hypothetical protein